MYRLRAAYDFSDVCAMSKPTIGLVIADTEAYVLANNAIHACISQFDFSSVHVFSDRIDLWPQHKCVLIPKIQGIDDYNKLVLQGLQEHIDEEYCIIAQYDGFILNPAVFSNEFYRFDYIGAVWPNFPYFRVGNGGFSWRSRRLVEAVAELALIRAPEEAEDLFICRSLRVILEERFGCKFADDDVAKRFSYEIMPDAQPSFGFHGVFNLPMVYRDNLRFLVENLPPRVLATRLGFLRYGAGLLDPQRRLEFEQLVATALGKL